MRISAVGELRIISTQLSSIVQLGDSVGLSAQSQVLAVQRSVSNFNGNEGDLRPFRIFSQPIPQPVLDESFSFETVNEAAEIQVGAIVIYGMSASAVLQIGSNREMVAENRTKHIRQLRSGKRPV